MNEPMPTFREALAKGAALCAIVFAALVASIVSVQV